jgi:hypothetical protein
LNILHSKNNSNFEENKDNGILQRISQGIDNSLSEGNRRAKKNAVECKRGSEKTIRDAQKNSIAISNK